MRLALLFRRDERGGKLRLAESGARLKTAAIGPRSVSLKIYGGEMLLAGVPGAYDTIMIDAESHIVRAIGTKFSLRKSGDSLSVDIIEGAVEVAEKSFDSPFLLQEGFSALFLRGSNPAVMNMPPSRTDSLCGLFSEIAGETCAGDDDLLWNIKVVNRADAIGDERSEKKASFGPYETALELYQKGRLHEAIDTLERYVRAPGARLFAAFVLMGDSHSRLRQYEKAVGYYQKAVLFDSPDEADTVMHIANRILLFRLGRLEQAEAEIKRYLARYPNGVYRQPQLQYLIRIYQKRGQTEKACSLMREFVGEYPENSPARPGLL